MRNLSRVGLGTNHFWYMRWMIAIMYCLSSYRRLQIATLRKNGLFVNVQRYSSVSTYCHDQCDNLTYFRLPRCPCTTDLPVHYALVIKFFKLGSCSRLAGFIHKCSILERIRAGRVLSISLGSPLVDPPSFC